MCVKQITDISASGRFLNTLNSPAITSLVMKVVQLLVYNLEALECANDKQHTLRLFDSMMKFKIE